MCHSRRADWSAFFTRLSSIQRWRRQADGASMERVDSPFHHWCGWQGRRRGRVEQQSGRLLPQVAMIRQLRIVDAEGGHERRVVGGQEVGVTAQMRIGGGRRSA